MSVDADLAFVGGSLWTGDPIRPRAQALAVADGRIAAVGDNASIRAVTGARTVVVDLAGRTLLPGFQDAHCHPPMGGIDRLRCDLSALGSPEEVLAAVAGYGRANPAAAWLLGGGWLMDLYGGSLPTAADLDAVTGERPAYFTEASAHTAWANSAALRIAGVDRDTPDPPGGYLERDENGQPTGILHDGATALVARFTPQVTADEWARAILLAQDYFLSCGITAWQDASVGDPQWGDSLEVYRRLDIAGDLHLKTVGSLWWFADRGEEQVQQMIDLRQRSHGRFQATTVKIMLDGIVETGTAALSKPYCKCFRSTAHDACMVPPEELKRYVTMLDAAGFQVHFHAIGDLASRCALDAIEAARNINGTNDNRHHIAHVQLVDPADIPRFAQLNVTANCQPLWACHSAAAGADLSLEALGAERYARQYPFASLTRAGARLAFGSDWNVTGAEPLPQLEVAVTRRHPDLRDGPMLAEHERLSLEQALQAFTIGSAYVNHLDRISGTLTQGKVADLCILDRDILLPESGPVADAQIDGTVIDGVVRYRRYGADI